MTRKRYLAVAGMLAILVGAGFGVGMMLPPAPGVTKANFDRIEIGMTGGDVEAILGERTIMQKVNGGSGGLMVWIDRWEGDNRASATIVYSWHESGEGRVASKRWTPSKETILEKLRRWLRL